MKTYPPIHPLVLDTAAICFQGDVRFAVDDTRHVIEGYEREKRATILYKLDKYGNLLDTGSPNFILKNWLYAQCLYWGVIDGRKRITTYLKDELKTLLETLPAIEPLHAHPRFVFEKLETAWAEHRAARRRSAGTSWTKKRTHDDTSSDESSASQSKRVKDSGVPAVLTPNGNARTRTNPSPAHPALKLDAFRANAEPTVQAESASIKAEPAANSDAAPAVCTPARSSTWKIQWAEVEAFKRKQYLLMAKGSYVVACPTIESTYPGLEGQLRLNINRHQDTEVDGILTGHLDLGFLKGIVAMGPNNHSLDVWCCLVDRTCRHAAHESAEPKDAETKRLEERLRVARDILGLEAESALPRVEVKVRQDRPPAFWGEYRCEEKQSLFSTLGTVFANSFRISFQDCTGMHFKGEINVPMLSDKAIELEGFKTSESPAVKTSSESWGRCDTSRVKYGSSWKN